MASSKSFFLLLCALLAFVLIASAEASISSEGSEHIDEVGDQSGASSAPPPDGEYAADGSGDKRGCKPCCRYERVCYKCCKRSRGLLEAQIEDDP